VKRLQIYIEEELDDALASLDGIATARRGVETLSHGRLASHPVRVTDGHVRRLHRGRSRPDPVGSLPTLPLPLICGERCRSHIRH
jgi:hypothetical protein